MTQEMLVEQIVAAILNSAQPVGADVNPPVSLQNPPESLYNPSMQLNNPPVQPNNPPVHPNNDISYSAGGKNATPTSSAESISSARIAVGRAGTRLRTGTCLQFRADHAAARDAVYNDVPAELLQQLNLPEFATQCQSRDEFLTRPDLGKSFTEETAKAIRAYNPNPCDVLVYAADGLSSKSLAANLENILPVILEGLSRQGLKAGKPFFVKYGRVASMEPIAEYTGAKVVCVLLGERPGLGSAESMSAYMAYAPTVGMPEARRTVVSNIYSGGLNAVEAGAYIAELLGKTFKAQKSGVEL